MAYSFQHLVRLLCGVFAALMLHTQAQSQTTSDLLGKWVNIHDTRTKLLLYKSGKARIAYQDSALHTQSVMEGFWRHRQAHGALAIYIGAGKQKQDYQIASRGNLGITLTNPTGSVVFARRVLEPGETLPQSDGE